MVAWMEFDVIYVIRGMHNAQRPNGDERRKDVVVREDFHVVVQASPHDVAGMLRHGISALDPRVENLMTWR